MRGSGRVGSVVLSLAVCGTVLTGHPSAAVAVGETCHGLTATIVGAPGTDLEGTSGPDVVVTNGAQGTYAGAGDDLICVTGGAGLDKGDSMYVDAADGDDVVDATSARSDRVMAYLGQGDDTFTGGPAADGVEANATFEDSPDGRTAGADSVSTGPGDDDVTTGGPPGFADHDTIDLGPGRDVAVTTGPTDPALPIQGGEGSDQLDLDRSSLRDTLVIDNAAQRATGPGGTAMSWSSFERFRLSHIGPYRPPSFIGGPGAERLQASVPLTSVDLGAGDDLVNLELQDKLVDHAWYAGGAGDDDFILYSGPGDQARRVRLDLTKDRLLFQREQRAVRARIDGFERHRLSADRLVFRGTAAADHVQWQGCHGVIAGGPGDDLVEEFSNPDVGCGYPVNHADLAVRGGSGDDRLLGGGAPNVLIGGPGRDLADGRGSDRDRCVAERERRCER